MTEEEINSMQKISLLDPRVDLTGLPYARENGKYLRIPEEMIGGNEASDDFYKMLAKNTSGGIARIRTNSKRIYFSARVPRVTEELYHMSTVGSSGFDFHVKFPGEEMRFIHPTTTHQYGKTDFATEVAVMYNCLYDGSGRKEYRVGQTYELTMVLPIYNSVEEAYVYIEKDAEIFPIIPRKYTKPVVFYGSSITQGACASRASNCYTNRIALELDTPIENYGFSGHARGAEWIANFIGKRDMSVFVMDYDHNADNIDMLKATHQKFYKIVRSFHPDTPVIFVTKPDYGFSLDDNAARRDVIKKTYEDAKAAGENVYFVDGEKFFEGAKNVCLVDNVHPNDLGFDKMTAAIKPLLKEILDKSL